MAAATQYYATGRRKTSTARVFLRPGSGAIKVNHREFEAFFPREALRMQIRTPLVLTETTDKFDVLATVAGGGVSGQAAWAATGGIKRPAKATASATLPARSRIRRRHVVTSATSRPENAARVRSWAPSLRDSICWVPRKQAIPHCGGMRRRREGSASES